MLGLEILLADEDADRARDLAAALTADPEIRIVRLQPDASLPEAVAGHEPGADLLEAADPARGGLRVAALAAGRLEACRLTARDPAALPHAEALLPMLGEVALDAACPALLAGRARTDIPMTACACARASVSG